MVVFDHLVALALKALIILTLNKNSTFFMIMRLCITEFGIGTELGIFADFLTLLGRRSLSYRNQSIDLQSKSMDWFLQDRDLRHERVKLG